MIKALYRHQESLAKLLKLFKFFMIAGACIPSLGALPAQAAELRKVQLSGPSKLDWSFDFFQVQGQREDLLKWLSQYKIIFVQGLAINLDDLFNKNFAPQFELLKSLGLKEGIDFELAPTSTMASIKSNSGPLAAAIRASQRPVLLISHSKGSADSIETLISNKDLWPKLVGWISMQGALKGSYLADLLTCENEPHCSDHLLGEDLSENYKVQARNITRNIIKKFFEWRNGDLQAVYDVRQDVRIKFLSDHSDEINEFLSQVPFYAVATADNEIDSAFAYQMQQKYFGKTPLAQDGLITTESEILPGAPYVFLNGIHHNELVLPGKGPLQKKLQRDISLKLLLLFKSKFN